MLHSSDTGRLEAEIKLLKQLEARYHKAILANEAFILLKKLYLEIKQSRERLHFLHTGITV